MSVSLVRKALEINTESPSGKSSGKGKKSQKLGGSTSTSKKQKKVSKKQRAEKLVKQNLKLLKVLEPPKSTGFKKKQRQKEVASGNSKPEKSAFTEDDFKKFEAEYFVTQ